MGITLKTVKLAAVREAGHPVGISAPCWFTCEDCGERWLAFQEGLHKCSCGVTWDPRGWRQRVDGKRTGR